MLCAFIPQKHRNITLHHEIIEVSISPLGGCKIVIAMVIAIERLVVRPDIPAKKTIFRDCKCLI